MSLNSTTAPKVPDGQSGNIVTMSSREIAELTGKRHPDVKRDIEKMLNELEEDVSRFAHIYQDSMNRDQNEYQLDRELTETLLLGYSAPLRRKVIKRLRELEETVYRPINSAEALLQMLQFQVKYERQQAEQVQALQQFGERLDRVSQAHTILDKMPSDCEAIGKIRMRIHKNYGLSAEIVTQIVRHSPYALTVRAIVRNPSVDAEGSHYSGYSKKEATAVFKRFVSECVQVTATMCTHPYIERRFRLVKGGAA
ncbi:Rha family transcriptional regulator [Ochrobactrum sp. MYb379]|uniref:Rha family transcriptional regulator n=1 Tax=Ochrobactrum sp. MYb379 TaxID=2745275 RepID=UPI0030978E0D